MSTPPYPYSSNTYTYPIQIEIYSQHSSPSYQPYASSSTSGQIPFPQPRPYLPASTSTYYSQPPRYPITPPKQVFPVAPYYAAPVDMNTTPEKKRRARDVWKEYMCGLGKSMSALEVDDSHRKSSSGKSSLDSLGKPLPRPPSAVTPASESQAVLSTPVTLSPDRPPSLPPLLIHSSINGSTDELKLSPTLPLRPDTTSHTVPVSVTEPVKTPPKTFKPSFHPNSKYHSSDSLLKPPSRPINTGHSQSDSILSLPTNKFLQPSSAEIIDLTGESPPTTPKKGKSPKKHERAASETPRSRTKSNISLGEISESASPARTSSPSSTAVRCAGFTRTGQPCKRLVKSEAPYLALRGTSEGDEGDDTQSRLVGRYCKDHAGMVCQAGGFYWRGKGGKSGLWIDFDEFVPSDLGQQTQTLLRMTMESSLTAKEMPGFLYAYELRDLQTPSTSFFKVGRTDNVPRRIGEWSKQCPTHTPTLRDIFPLPLSRTPSILRAQLPNHVTLQSQSTSFLPGAVSGGTTQRQMVPAVKRWERLVHLELAERALQSARTEWETLRNGGVCKDCGMVHKEIFPIGRVYSGAGSMQKSSGEGATVGKRAYEDVVIEVICRWERFVRRISDGEA